MINTRLRHRYQLLEKLGQGGMGLVYKAFDRLSNQRVALKRVLASTTDLQFSSQAANRDSHEQRVALGLEFRTLAALRHPHIISVLDYGFDEEKFPFFTMELVPDAKTLLQYSTGKNREEKTTLLINILQAVAYLHRHAILHRDLKPENILVNPQGLLKVMDFGLALQSSVSQSRVHEGTVGTPSYMAPELFQDQAPSIASDLYAFGVIAYELFLDKKPFPAPNLMAMLLKVMQETPDLSGVDRGLGKVLDKLLSKVPEDRYGSADEVLVALCDANQFAVPQETYAIRESFLQASRFVGRRKEIEQLTNALSLSMAGTVQCCLIGGESGVGKSRLMEEIRVRALVDGVLVLSGQGIREGGLPYQLWREMLRHILLIVEISDEEAFILKTLVPDISELLGHPIPDLGYDNLAIQKRLPLIMISLLQSLSNQYPVLLLLEDLQWTVESLDILTIILAELSTARLMILASFRSDESPNLREKLKEMQYIELERLPREDIFQLSQGILGEIARNETLIERIERESEGNTFFILEVVRAMAAQAGQLANIGRSDLPSKILSKGMSHILERRISQLPEWVVQSVQLAAVAGRQINPQLLTEIIPALDLELCLRTAGEAAVFAVSGESWQFAHDKLREYIYDNLEEEKRRKAHLQIAEALEKLYTNQIKDYAALLVLHFSQGGDERKTAAYAVLASETTLEHSSTDACRYAEQAIALKAHEQVENSQKRLAYLHLLLAKPQIRLYRYDDALQSLTRSRSIYEQLNDHINVAICKQYLGEISIFMGNFTEALIILEEALAVLSQTEDWLNIAYCHMNIGNIYGRQSQYAKAHSHFEQSLHIMEKTSEPIMIARALNNLGIIHDMQGQWDKALELYNRSLAIRREIKDKRGIGFSLINLAALAFDQERYNDAKTLRLEALALMREINDTRSEANALDALGSVEAKLGNLEVALNYYLEALALARTNQHNSLLPLILRNLGNLQERLGLDPGPMFYEALEFAEKAEIMPNKLQCLKAVAGYLKNAGQGRLALRCYLELKRYGDYSLGEDINTGIEELKNLIPEQEFLAMLSNDEKELDTLIRIVLDENKKII